ncbi:MAG TPA: T9SS type A sorting domain-containing protein, partial [Saprospiraceae bacterium]|nr:T9SS type A sorting domain-containing protein [Saprospiraceae bacterium]
GTELFAFTFNAYYIFDGETLEEHEHIGLPHSFSDLLFALSDNNTVYAIVDNNKVFRASSPVVRSKEVQAPVHVKLFPNPTHDFISISVSENELKLFDSYEIIDVLGCRVQSTDLTGSLISVSHMTPGIYTLLLKGTRNVLRVGKFIKL